MTDFEKLELLLRRHGFLAGVMTDEDRKCTEALLADLPPGDSRALFDAREEFLSMIADAGECIAIEPDGDETGNHSTIILTVGWSQLRDFIDALGIPELNPSYRDEAETVKDRIEAAAESPTNTLPPNKLPLPTKCEGCSEAATLCETCALDRATSNV